MHMEACEYAHDGGRLPSRLEPVGGILRPLFTSLRVRNDVGYTTCVIGSYFRPAQLYTYRCEELRHVIAIEYRLFLFIERLLRRIRIHGGHYIRIQGPPLDQAGQCNFRITWTYLFSTGVNNPVCRCATTAQSRPHEWIANGAIRPWDCLSVKKDYCIW